MKQMALIGAGVFGTAGAFIPAMFGDTSPLSGWSILLSTVGGFVGIWVGVKVYKMMS